MKGLLIAACLIFSLQSLASENDYAEHHNRTLSKISIEGNSKTSRDVIMNELDVKVGSTLTAYGLEESYKRLFNLRIFSEVEFSLEMLPDDQSKLNIKVQERWTLIPIAKLTSGGGTTQFTAGAYDINVLGSFIEVGAQYENLNGSDGFVHWFRNPRLLGTRIRSGYDIWNVTRNRLLFSSDVDEGDVAEETSAYTVNMQKYNFFLAKEFVYWFVVGAGFDYTRQEATDDGLSEEFRDKNLNLGFSPPDLLDETAYYTYLRLGRLNFTNYLVEGFQTDVNLRFADSGLGGNENSYRLTHTSKAFFLLPHEQNIGVNVSTGHSNSDSFQNNFFVGGFENVRGFQDGQFIGKHFWQANLEYRVSSYKSHWLVLQHNFFYDIGNTADNEGQLLQNNPNEAFQSVGAGIRLISPAIYRFNLRVDFAQGLNYNRAFDISFGLQQFF
ncbi:MAG: BamA/TamA family outer membrane protein [Bdellovibrionales bacterium]|nr:BamA/TamA family outer membrane protein [Bdellovibrionales bacterium]